MELMCEEDEEEDEEDEDEEEDEDFISSYCRAALITTN
jgi:hypothetical protein